MKNIGVGSRVKFSTVYIRSLGCVGQWRCEVIGTVVEVLRLDGWSLVLVQWDKNNGFSEVNPQNLVALADVHSEARKAESNRVPGLVIGSNAFTLQSTGPAT